MKRRRFDGYGSSSDDEIDKPTDKEQKGPSRYLGVQFARSSSATADKQDVERPSMRSNLMSDFNLKGGNTDQEKGKSAQRNPFADNSTKPSSSHVSSYGIGAKLLSKMGYVAGKGLGADGKGIVEPVQQKLRPQGAGLGAINEKTEQAKRDAARKKRATNQGKYQTGDDSWSDSSEDQISFKGAPRSRKPKNVYKTIEEMEASGLQLPSGFKYIIDMSQGPDGKLVEDLSNITVNDRVSSGPDLVLLYTKAKNDVEQATQQWALLQGKQKNVEFEISNIDDALGKVATSLGVVEKLVNTGNNIQNLLGKRNDLAFGIEMDRLLNLLEESTENKSMIQEIAISAFSSYYPSVVSGWNPLDMPELYVEEIKKWFALLKYDENDSAHTGFGDISTVLYNTWLPKMQSFMLQNWACTHPYRAILFIEKWRNIVGEKLVYEFLSRCILPKLIKSLKEEKGTLEESETVVSPWLDYLHRDQKQELFDTASMKLNDQIRSWSPSHTLSLIRSLSFWLTRLQSSDMIRQRIVSRLLDYMKRYFQIDPSDQNNASLEAAIELNNAGVLDDSDLGTVLADGFFPKFKDVLHQWLVNATDEGLYELGQWYETWYNWFGEGINLIPSVQSNYEECLDLINEALDMKNRGMLQKPADKPENSISFSSSMSKEKLSSPDQAPNVQVTFRDLVEEYCIEHDLFLMPLKKAHPIHGHALYKISSSPSGANGITCYFDEDVLWANSKLDRKRYEPVVLEELENLV